MTLVLLSAVSCQKNTGPVAATINQDRISVADIQRRLMSTPSAFQQYSASPEGRKEFVKLLVREKILLQEAKRTGLAKDATYTQTVKDFKEDLDRRYIEYQDQLLIRSFLRKLQAGELAVSDAELRQYYDSHPEEFQKPLAIEVSHILVPTEGEAEAIRQRLQKGEPFDTLARQMSKDPATANRGGKLDPIKRGMLVPEFEEAAFRLKVGETSTPVKSPFGFHIIRKTGEKALPPQPFDTAKAEIRARLEKGKFDSWIQQKEAAASIHVDEAALTSLKS